MKCHAVSLRLMIAAVAIVGAAASCSGGADESRDAGAGATMGAGGGATGGANTGGNDASSGGASGGQSSDGGTGGLTTGSGGSGADTAGGGGLGGAAPEVPCDKPFEAGRQSFDLDVSGTLRRFLFYVPSSYDGSSALPLIFNLHPTGSTPEAHMDATQMEPIADERSFFIASMAGVNNSWNVLRDPGRPDEVEFAKAILDWADEHVCLNEQRVYSTGFSGGARTSSLLGCAMTDRISGIAPVAGVRNDPPCDGVGVDVLVIHGTGDAVNYYQGCPAGDTACSRNGEWGESVESALADWRVKNGCAGEPAFELVGSNIEHQTWSGCSQGGDVEFYKVPDGAHVWDLLENTTEVVVNFFLAH